MPTCSLHGSYSGSRCFQCDLADDFSRQRQALERAEEDAALRHREAEDAADYRARRLEEHREELVRDANKIRARAHFERARELLKAKLYDEAIATAQDAIEEDRGYFPAYALLASVLFDTDRRSEAATAMGKAIRLLGIGEWSGTNSYSAAFSWIGEREFPQEVMDQLRAKVESFTQETDYNLLSWVASKGWGDQALSLLSRAHLQIDETLRIADHLRGKGQIGASEAVLARALRSISSSSKEAPIGSWVKIGSRVIELELEGGTGDFRAKLLRMAEGWSADQGYAGLQPLLLGGDLKALSDFNRETLCAMLAPCLVNWLNARQPAYVSASLAKLPAPSALLGWLESAKRKAEEQRERCSAEAKTTFRGEAMTLVCGAGFEGFVAPGESWHVTERVGAALEVFLGEVCYKAGIRHQKKQEWSASIDALRKAKQHFAAAGKTEWEGDAAHELGRSFCLTNKSEGQWEEALSCFEQEVELARNLGLHGKVCQNLYWKAWCLEPGHHPSGDRKTAADLYRQVIEAAQSNNDLSHQLWSCDRIGFMAREARDWGEAVAAYRRAAECARTLGDPAWEGTALFEIGACLEKTQEWKAAGAAFEEALEVRRAAGNTREEVRAIRAMGFCLSRPGTPECDWERALTLFKHGADLAEGSGIKDLFASCTYWQAWCREPDNNPVGDWKHCISLYERAAQLAAEAEFPALEAEALHAVGWCYQPVNAPFGDWETSVTWLERAIPIWESKGLNDGLARSFFAMAKSMSRGDESQVSPAATELFRRASKLFREAGNDTRAAEAAKWAGEIG